MDWVENIEEVFQFKSAALAGVEEQERDRKKCPELYLTACKSYGENADTAHDHVDRQAVTKGKPFGRVLLWRTEKRG